MHCIVMQNVEQVYGTKRVLSNINIEIDEGTIYGVLGPSGCGKTTLVKAMAGILVPTAGTVQVLDTVMPNLEAMNQIGYMAQSDALYPNLTGKENLEFFGALYGMKREPLQKAIQSAMALVNLTDATDKLVRNYSGGMKRRLSLAAAILHQPKILILDEPTVGIDPLLRRDIWQELHKMAQAGTAIIVTTHVMDEADHCAKLFMMREGCMLAAGSPDEIRSKYQAATIEEAFIKLGEAVEEP